MTMGNIVQQSNNTFERDYSCSETWLFGHNNKMTRSSEGKETSFFPGREHFHNVSGKNKHFKRKYIDGRYCSKGYIAACLHGLRLQGDCSILDQSQESLSALVP